MTSDLDKAVDTASGPYSVGAPRKLLTDLEYIASGIAFERETEGRRITPNWWVHHVGARLWTLVVLDGAKRLFDEVQQSIVARVESNELQNEPEAQAFLIFRGLEISHKMAWGTAGIHQTLASLRTLENANAG